MPSKPDPSRPANSSPSKTATGKFGRIKRQHGRVNGLDAMLERLLAEAPGITKIVPGRMGRKRGKTPPKLKVQYETAQGSSAATGLKCIWTCAGSWQEVFIVCEDPAACRTWIETNG